MVSELFYHFSIIWSTGYCFKPFQAQKEIHLSFFRLSSNSFPHQQPAKHVDAVYQQWISNWTVKERQPSCWKKRLHQWLSSDNNGSPSFIIKTAFLSPPTFLYSTSVHVYFPLIYRWIGAGEQHPAFSLDWWMTEIRVLRRVKERIGPDPQGLIGKSVDTISSVAPSSLSSFLAKSQQVCTVFIKIPFYLVTIFLRYKWR